MQLNDTMTKIGSYYQGENTLFLITRHRVGAAGSFREVVRSSFSGQLPA